MFAEEKALRTIEILKGEPFTCAEASFIYNDLPGPSEVNVHGILKALRKVGFKIEYIGRRKGQKWYEVITDDTPKAD